MVEVDLSNLHDREPHRSQSLTGPAAFGVITGLGERGYTFALEYLIDRDE